MSEEIKRGGKSMRDIPAAIAVYKQKLVLYLKVVNRLKDAFEVSNSLDRYDNDWQLAKDKRRELMAIEDCLFLTHSECKQCLEEAKAIIANEIILEGKA